MIKKALCIFLVALLFPALASAKDLTVGRDLVLSGKTDRPVSLEVSDLEGTSLETITVHPYRADLTGIKNELENYRWSYLIVQAVVVAGLALAVSSK